MRPRLGVLLLLLFLLLGLASACDGDLAGSTALDSGLCISERLEGSPQRRGVDADELRACEEVCGGGSTLARCTFGTEVLDGGTGKYVECVHWVSRTPENDPCYGSR